MARQAELTTRYQSSLMNTFGTPKLVLDRGAGCRVWDVDGREYLDLLAGIAVNALGHSHPDLVQALGDQAAMLGHVSNFFATPPQVELAERLSELLGAGESTRTFFTNSGTEANETAFKVTRKLGRTKIVAMEGAFHGRTLGALALTANPAYREPFEPLPGAVTFVPYGDVAALAAAVDGETAAVVLEPIQGENGVVAPPVGFLQAAREVADQHGALLWLDEVQTGVGRTGYWFAHQREGIVPDLVTLAKGLGGGFPIGACLATGRAAELLVPGNHGNTFGGNALAARAGLTVLDVIVRDGLLEHVVAMGRHLEESVLALNNPGVVGVRGAGLLRGIVLAEPIAPQVVDAALSDGFILNAPRPNVLRIVPPLVVSAVELDRFVAALPGWL